MVVLILKLCFLVSVWILFWVFCLISGLFFSVCDVVDVDILVILVSFVKVSFVLEINVIIF